MESQTERGRSFVGYLETFKLALQNVLASKMRSFLTMLGIIIGVTAVIVIVGFGNGMENYMRDQFAELGTNSLNVMLIGRGSTRSVSEEQMYDIVAENQELLDQISPSVSINGGIKVGTESYSSTTISGVSEDWFDMKNWSVSKGRGLQYMDIEDRKNICVVGAYIDQEYFGGQALGESIRISGKKFTIVGVREQKEDDMDEGGSDDCVFIPYSTAARMSWTGTIGSYTVTVQNEDNITEAKELIEDKLYDVYGDDSAYNVMSVSEILDMMTSIINVIISVLAIIAGISLVVGGIGIMNIMLVSVTERTREIGIRKALGAREGIILRQFVLEAATTSALGGVLGIILGFVLSLLASKIVQALLDEPLTVSPSWGSVLLAFGISAGIGVLFGYLPARKAANLNPIDALRYE